MKKAMWVRGAIILAALTFSIVGLTFSVPPDLTTALNASVDYPMTTIGGKTVGGMGTQQVFRLGSSTATGIFTGLNPKTGACPSGPASFLSGNTGTVGASDFVYAIKIANRGDSSINVDTLLTGLCEGHTPITSIGFCPMPPLKNPTTFQELNSGLDYTFGSGQAIPPGDSSTILFYTSPDPPALQPTIIGTSGVGSQGFQTGNPANLTPIYGACPTSLMIDKKIGCSPTGPFGDLDLTAVTGAPIYYQITVKNTGMTPLDNVMVTDPKLKPGGDLTGDFTFPDPSTPGHLEPNGMIMHVFGPFTAATGPGVPGTSVNGQNTACANGVYMIPDPQGNPTGQVFNVPEVCDSVTLNVVEPGIACNKTVSPASFDALPVTLTYTLKALNTGSTDLSVNIDDPKLRAIIAVLPSGVTASAAIHAGPSFASGMLTGGNLPAIFPVVDKASGVKTMAQVDITLTIMTVDALKAIADGPAPPASAKLTNTMTATGTVTNFVGCSTGNTTVSCQNSVAAMFRVPCALTLEKTVACGIAPSDADFGETATALRNANIVYRFKVTNTGIPGISDTVNNVVINDSRLGGPIPVMAMLAPGQMKVIDVMSTAPNTVGPLTNTATASGTCMITGDQAQSLPDSATVTVIDPQVSCSKLANDVTNLTNYMAGQFLTFTLKATNAASSGTNLDLKVDDPVLKTLPGITCKVDGSNVTLPHTFTNVPPGGMGTVTCTVTFPTADAFKAAAGNSLTLNNTMSVMGTLPTGSKICTNGANPGPPFTSSCSAAVTIVPKPVLVLTKEVACDSPALDCATGAFQTTTPANPLKVLRSPDGTMTAAVRYRYRVTNMGDITVKNIKINDDTVPGLFTVASLVPGAASNFICSSSFTPPPGLTTNIARATGTSDMSATANNVQSNQATATVQVQQPTLSCSLSATDCLNIGDPVTITLKLTNGPVPVLINSISGLPGLSPIPLPFTLGPNEMKAIPVTFTTVADLTTVTVTVNGTVVTAGFCATKADGTAVSTSISTNCTIDIPCPRKKCSTLCFRSAQFWLLNVDHLPTGTVLVGGVNNNIPISTTNVMAVTLALKGGPLPLQQLNREFVAAQLNLDVGSGGVTTNYLWANLSCYAVFSNFTPVQLSNGVTITGGSMLKDLWMQARAAILENRTADMVKLAGIFRQLNGNNPNGRCSLTH